MSKQSPIEQYVISHLDELRGMGYKDLVAQGMSRFPSKAGYVSFRKNLIKHGIDYDSIQSAHRAGKAAAREEAFAEARKLILFSDAKAKFNRFGICDRAGNPLWYGQFYDPIEEQSAAEMEAAKKAVWLASQIGQRAGQRIELHLVVDAEWLTWADAGDGRGGKAKALAHAAERAGIKLVTHWISGQENPADEYTICRGYLKWQEGLPGDVTSMLQDKVDLGNE